MKTLPLLVLFLALAAICGNGSAIRQLTDTPPVTIGPGQTIGTAEYRETARPVPPVPAALTIRRIHPARAKAGETIAITIRIVSEEDKELQVTLSEDQRPGPEYPDPLPVSYLQFQGLKIPYYTWSLDLPGRAAREVTYHIRPRNPGTITFTPAVAWDQQGGTVRSDSSFIIIECVPDGRCDRGDTYLYCPGDCPSGSADGTCDGITDDRIDPDCAPGADPDAGGGTAGGSPAERPVTGLAKIPAVYGIIAVTGIACAAGLLLLHRQRKAK